MIKLTEKAPDIIKMEITMHLPQSEVIEFLQKQGYEITAYLLKLPAEKGFLIDEPATEHWTFTATKNGEEPSNDNIFTRVFQREMRKLLKEI